MAKYWHFSYKGGPHYKLYNQKANQETKLKKNTIQTDGLLGENKSGHD